MGLGGDTTALDVHIETAGTHTASLPVAISFGCWAKSSRCCRDAKRGVVPDSKVKLEMTEFRLNVPQDNSRVTEIRVGDVLYVTGDIAIARDQAHRNSSKPSPPNWLGCRFFTAVR